MTNYDIAQICLNGHIVNGAFQTCQEDNADHCEKCGEKTITQCPECSASIKGDVIEQGLTGEIYSTVSLYLAPGYCASCGKPYPWTKVKIETALQMFVEFGNLDDKEKETIEQDIVNISKDVPQAELSARRIQEIWRKCNNIAYNIIMEFASKTAAEILKTP